MSSVLPPNYTPGGGVPSTPIQGVPVFVRRRVDTGTRQYEVGTFSKLVLDTLISSVRAIITPPVPNIPLAISVPLLGLGSFLDMLPPSLMHYFALFDSHMSR